MKNDSFISVVLVHDQPLATLENSLLKIQDNLDEHYSDYEIVVVGQGTMRGFTQEDDAILEKILSLRFIQLAARVHPDVLWAAALENAIGDFVVLFNPGIDPVETISKTVALCKSGFDVVVGVADQPRTLTYRIFRSVADRILKLADYALPRNATSLRCLSRRSVNAVTGTGFSHHQLFMRIQKTGYVETPYNYKILSTGQAKIKRSLLSGVQDLLRLMVFNSYRPLRLMSAFGLLGSAIAFIFAGYSLLIHLVKGNVVEGWTTTIFFMSALFMMQFVMMSFFGEYLARLLDERNEHAEYSVVFEKNSRVMVNQDRLNVLNRSDILEDNQVQTGRDR